MIPAVRGHALPCFNGASTKRSGKLMGSLLFRADRKAVAEALPGVIAPEQYRTHSGCL